MKRLLTLMLLACGLTTDLWASSVPGALPGRFTINASGEKVVFSQGNLQYQASTNTWRFAENQYDYIGNAAGNTSPSSSQTAWIDYFNWGTSGYNHGANCYQPWSTSTSRSDYYAYGSSTKSLYDAKDDDSMRGQADWGYNAINNGGNAENKGWRTLSKEEWAYIINTRSNDYRYAKGTIHSQNGFILFPDGFALPTGVSISNANTPGAGYTLYSDDNWAALETSGCVFLPATGMRNGTNVYETGSVGNYWSSTYMNSERVYNIRFDGSSLKLENDGDRQNGFPVRLVRSSLQQDNEGYYLLGSVQDWQDFAALVQTTPTANAKMTADIDLGNDQTHIGSMTQEVGPFYSGTFDGQGHTLTIAYDDRTGNKIVAPFTQIRNATIKNLKVAGSIYSTFAFIGVVGYVNGGGNSYISNVLSSASFTCAHSGWNHTSGIVGSVGNSATANISDCIVTGSVSGGSYSSTFVGCIYGGTAYTSNCLSTGTLSVSDYTLGTTTNCYIKGYSAEVTDDNLSNGTITAYLQNNRAETVWVQDPLTNQPMLALFAGKYKVPASGLGTFSAKAKFNVPEGLEAYYCKNYDSTEGTISVEAINGVVPAETGVLLRGTPGVTYTLTATNAAAATVTDNALVAVTEQTTIQQIDGSYTNFGLSGGEFKKVNPKGGTVKANRAYLHILTSALTSEAISLVWDEDITSVNDIRSKSDDERGDYYNLNGQRVAHPAKGLYIVNGKKVIIK